MAKYEKLGYCPNNDVSGFYASQEGKDYGKPWLYGMWRLFGNSVVFESTDLHDCDIDVGVCKAVFTTDPIAESVMVAIIRKDVNADKILVKQLHAGACNTQHLEDIQKVLGKVMEPQLIMAPGSRFVAILAKSDEGLDLWVWDLQASY